jgi:hypothetical protein
VVSAFIFYGSSAVLHHFYDTFLKRAVSEGCEQKGNADIAFNIDCSRRSRGNPGAAVLTDST